MKIDTLQMENFRCFADQTFAFEASRVLIVGDHETGKSTAQDAIRWVLTGRCRGLDWGGRGVADLVRNGGQQMVVAVRVTHRGQTRTVVREWKKGRTLLSMDGVAAAECQEALCTWLGVDIETLTAILDGEFFMGLAHQDAKALVMKLLSVKVTLPSGEEVGLDMLDAAYETVFNERRVLKREHEGGKPPVAPEAAGDVDGVAARLDEIRKARETLIAKRGEGHGREAVLREELVQLTMRRDRLIDLGNSEAVNVDNLRDVVQQRTQIAEAKGAEVMRAKTAYREAKEASGALDREELSRTITALESHDPKKGCVLHREVPCLTKAKEFRDAAKVVALQTSMFSALDEAQGIVRQAERDWQDAVAEANNAAQAVKSAEEFDAQLQGLEAEVAKRTAALPAQTETASLSDEIATLDDRIKKGEEVLARKRVLVAQKAKYDRELVAWEARAATLKKVETDVQLLGPTGLRVAALASAINRFEGAINQELATFGYVLKLTVQPWEVSVNGRPIELLSTSARWRVCVALQVALARMTEVGFTLIDQVELLLPKPRKALTAMVMASPLEQVVLVKAHDPDAEVPRPTGVQVFQLESPVLAPA